MSDSQREEIAGEIHGWSEAHKGSQHKYKRLRDAARYVAALAAFAVTILAAVAAPVAVTTSVGAVATLAASVSAAGEFDKRYQNVVRARAKADALVVEAGSPVADPEAIRARFAQLVEEYANAKLS